MDASPYRFELLTAGHDLAAFNSSPVTDPFLKRDALNETQIDRSRTYVLIDSEADHADAVIGFFTLHAHSYAWQSKTIPVVELAYLARHSKLRGKKFGEKLLTQAFRCIEQASRSIAIEGVSLYQTPDGKKLYDRFNFGAHPFGGNMRLLHINDVRSYVRLFPE